jgi:hypothetical protein
MPASERPARLGTWVMHVRPRPGESRCGRWTPSRSPWSWTVPGCNDRFGVPQCDCTCAASTPTTACAVRGSKAHPRIYKRNGSGSRSCGALGSAPAGSSSTGTTGGHSSRGPSRLSGDPDSDAMYAAWPSSSPPYQLSQLAAHRELRSYHPGGAEGPGSTKPTKETHMSVPTEDSAGATAIRPFTIPVTPERKSRRCVRASRPRAGPTRSSSPISRRAYSSQRFGNLRAIGPPTTTSGGWRRG